MSNLSHKFRAIKILAVSFLASVAILVFPGLVQAAPANTGQGGLIGDGFCLSESHLPLDYYPIEAVTTAVADLDVRWIRCVFAWSDMQKAEGGPIDFRGTDAAVAAATEKGINLLVVIGFSPPWANSNNTTGDFRYPPDDDHLDDWQAFLSEVCSRYADSVGAWEVWNEENIQFWQPEPDHVEYMKFLAATAPVIKALDPDSTVLMGGLAGLGNEFMEECLAAGAADYIDGVAYHPYSWLIGPPTGNRPKEQTARFCIDWVRNTISRYTAKDLEIWITEVGWPVMGTGQFKVDEETQASYIFRTLVNYADSGVERMVLYATHDEFSPTGDDSYGIYNDELIPRRAAFYVHTFMSQVGSAASRINADSVLSCSCEGPSSLEIHAFRMPDGSFMAAAWKADDAPDQLSLQAREPTIRRVERIDLYSGKSVQPAGFRYGEGANLSGSIPVGKEPVLLHFSDSLPPEENRVYLAEGSTQWGFDTYITIQNPGSIEVEAEITYLLDNMGVTGPTVSMPPASQATVFPSATLGGADFSTSVRATGGERIAADRTVSWTGPGSAVPEAHNSTGTSEKSTRWLLPEGSSSWGFESWVLIQNPSGSVATCTLTYMLEGAETRSYVKTVPAHSRATFSMAEDIGEADASIMVESTVPIIVERSMYRNARREGHGSFGATAPSVDFYLAEGSTAWGFETYLLIQNPNETENTVNVTYMTGSGPLEQPEFTMAPFSRKTIFVNSVANNLDLSMWVHGSLPIVAERAVYWHGGQDNAEVCHDSIGVPSLYSSYFLPDGQSSDGRETWTMVQNPHDLPVRVRITHMTETGQGNLSFTETLPPNSRKTYDLSSTVPNARAATLVESLTDGKGLVVERSMYWNDRGTGTNSIGAFQ